MAGDNFLKIDYTQIKGESDLLDDSFDFALSDDDGTDVTASSDTIYFNYDHFHNATSRNDTRAETPIWNWKIEEGETSVWEPTYELM